jgi:LmbE family N-acetylglucosaminyl deacetylase
MTADSPADEGLADAPRRTSFFFSAHPDDWQLFMNPAAFRDVLAGVKTVFVHVTAGDAGHGTAQGGHRHPYYVARERGVLAAIRFMADAGGQAPFAETSTSAPVGGHSLLRISYRNMVAYFLRLPDGSPQGDGYAETGNHSLKRLATGEINTLSAIDGAAVYRGWQDLVATLHNLIARERLTGDAIDLHVHDTDPARNPGDHPDHVWTAKAALAAIAGWSDVRIVHHLGYAAGDRPENLDGLNRDMKCAVFAVTLAAIQALDHATHWRHYDKVFVGRDYYRIEDGVPTQG